MTNDTTLELLDRFGAETQPVNSRWEPCPAFSAAGPGSPVCAGCGWLDGEHSAHPLLAA